MHTKSISITSLRFLWRLWRQKFGVGSCVRPSTARCPTFELTGAEGVRVIREWIKMKLYLAILSWDYEGSEVIGVFDTKEAAQSACGRHKDVDWRGNTREVVEMELNEDTWKVSL